MVKNILKLKSGNCKMISENCDHLTSSLMENVPLRVNNASSAECIEKSLSGIRESQNEKGFESHIPRPPLGLSNSCNDALKNNLSKFRGRTSKIPKSKSIIRTEKGYVKIESAVQSEEISTVGKSNKKQLINDTEIKPDELKEIVLQNSNHDDLSKALKTENVSQSTFEKNIEFEQSKNIQKGFSSTTIKSCETEVDLKYEEFRDPNFSATSVKSQLSEYRDAEEDLNNSWEYNDEFPEGERVKDENEGEKQERGIRTLYEALKSTGPMFDNFKWFCEKNQDYTLTEDFQNLSLQQCYDVTLEEVSDIWKNTISLISSVKEHLVKFIENEQEANSLDKEQLTLEGEMVQLAVDFAINYSKLKTDILIKSVTGRLGVENLTKTSLEEFMDSKTFAALYNENDLATMSRTIKDLNANVLKEELSE